MSDASRIRRAYDGSALAYRSLLANGWGTLANLGFYPLLLTPLLLGGLGFFQRLLARKSIRLLDPQPSELILDVATGGGWTASRIARRGARVLGVDLLAEHIAEARRRYGGEVTFAVADATRLPDELEGVALGPESVDRIHCLEAGFEFGAKGRRDFLEEAYRLLRPGGRLVIVDFTWPDEHPNEISRYDPDSLVRDTWQFDEFEPLARYRRQARELGFAEHAVIDWSRPVTGRFVRIAWTLTLLAQNPVARFVYGVFRPGIFRLWNEDWPHLLDVMRAHRTVQDASSYTAMVFDKPGS